MRRIRVPLYAFPVSRRGRGRTFWLQNGQEGGAAAGIGRHLPQVASRRRQSPNTNDQTFPSPASSLECRLWIALQ